MKLFTSKFFPLLCFALLIFSMVNTSSCKKDDTCHGKVTVNDSLGNLVSGASVHLDAQGYKGSSDATYDGVTDGTGVADFSIKLPAVFDVTVKSTSPAASGKGLLRVDEPGKSASVTVVIK